MAIFQQRETTFTLPSQVRVHQTETNKKLITGMFKKIAYHGDDLIILHF